MYDFDFPEQVILHLETYHIWTGFPVSLASPQAWHSSLFFACFSKTLSSGRGRCESVFKMCFS